MSDPKGDVKVRQVTALSGLSRPIKIYACSSDSVHVAKVNRYDGAKATQLRPVELPAQRGVQCDGELGDVPVGGAVDLPPGQRQPPSDTQFA